MNVSADKSAVEVDQPVTLRISISGEGNIKSVAEPVIPDLDDFRIYRASSNEKTSFQNDRLRGTKIFEEVFIPRRPGKLEIPPLKFAYFDPGAGKFKQVASPAIKLDVSKPEGYVAQGEVPYGAPGLTIGSEAKDIRHIKSELGHWRSKGHLILFSPVYLVVNGLPLLALLGLIVWRRRQDHLSADIGLARSRAASRMARKRLAKAKGLVGSGDTEPLYAEIRTAVTSYMADKLNISPHGLTMEKITELLQQRQAEPELIDELAELLSRCDFARYAPGASALSSDELVQQAEQIMVRMEGLKLG
jgi:hypothetical protein